MLKVQLIKIRLWIPPSVQSVNPLTIPFMAKNLRKNIRLKENKSKDSKNWGFKKQKETINRESKKD